jgi:hypothetical protein
MISMEKRGRERRVALDSEMPVLAWADRVEKEADRLAQRECRVEFLRAKKKVDEAKMYLCLMSTDEMILIMKIEDFLTRHTYVGRHWMTVMKNLVGKYARKV